MAGKAAGSSPFSEQRCIVLFMLGTIIVFPSCAFMPVVESEIIDSSWSLKS